MLAIKEHSSTADHAAADELLTKANQCQFLATGFRGNGVLLVTATVLSIADGDTLRVRQPGRALTVRPRVPRASMLAAIDRSADPSAVRWPR